MKLGESFNSNEKSVKLIFLRLLSNCFNFQTFGNQSGSDEVVRSQMNMRRKSRAEVKYGDPYE